MVVIEAGQTMLLDTDTPVLSVLLIKGGTFIFDRKDIHLQAGKSCLERIFHDSLLFELHFDTVFPRIVVHAPIYETEAMVHAPKVSPKCTFFLPQKYKCMPM